MLSLTSYYLVTLPVAYALGIHNINLLIAFSAGSYIYIMGCYVPIPGATGGMEYGFYGFYGNFIDGSELTSLMIIWRFITYYLPTVFGAIIYNIGPGKEIKGRDIDLLIKGEENE